MSVSGGCYCGEVSYTLADNPVNGVSCHCVTCQKLHSHNSYNVQSEASKLTVTKGTPKVFADNKSDSGKTINRYFCGSCGSALYSIPESMPAFIKVGSLELAAVKNVKLAAEIYAESAMGHSLGDKAIHGHKRFEGMMAKEV